MAQYQSRNKLLMLSKKDLIKACKKQNLNTFGCLAKMDFVKLLLNANSNDKKGTKGIGIIKPKKKRKKQLSLSEPVPLPSPVDPSEMTYIAYDDDTPKPDDENDNENKNGAHNVQFSDLPWKMDELKINTPSDDTNKKGIQHFDETAISPKGSKEIITILPGWGQNKSLKTVFTDELKEENSSDSDDSNEDVFVTIDKALGDYYKSFLRKDYFNDKGQGKFLLYVRDKKLDDMEEFEKYFGTETDLGVDECTYLSFDENFPVNEYAPLPDDDEYDTNVIKMIEIYNVVEYCYQHRKSPY